MGPLGAKGPGCALVQFVLFAVANMSGLRAAQGVHIIDWRDLKQVLLFLAFSGLVRIRSAAHQRSVSFSNSSNISSTNKIAAVTFRLGSAVFSI